MEVISILLAEDNSHFRNGLLETIRELPEIKLIGAACNGKELLEMAEKTRPGVVLTDIRMPEMDGIVATQELMKRYPDLGVIALTGHDDEWYLVQMKIAGARGYLYKESTEEEIMAAIEEVYNGGYCFSRASMVRLRDFLRGLRIEEVKGEKAGLLLTHIEREILRMTVEGFRTREIASELGLTIDVVKKSRQAMTEKTESRNWAGVVMYAVKHNII